MVREWMSSIQFHISNMTCKINISAKKAVDNFNELSSRVQDKLMEQGE